MDSPDRSTSVPQEPVAPALEDVAGIRSAALERREAKFRLIRWPGGEAAVKLEDFWWRLLEDAAAVNALSLNDFIATALDGLPDGENRTAHLRRCAAAALRRSGRLATASSSGEVMRLMHAAPTPVIIASRVKGAIIDVNEATIRVLERRMYNFGTVKREDITMRQFVDDVVARARKSAPTPLQAEIGLHVGDQKQDFDATIALMRIADSVETRRRRWSFDDWLVCYLKAVPR